jgi:hypothetical protein
MSRTHDTCSYSRMLCFQLLNTLASREFTQPAMLTSASVTWTCSEASYSFKKGKQYANVCRLTRWSLSNSV